MQIRLISVGKKSPAWVQQGFSEYKKRFSAGISLELIEIPLAHRGKNADINRLIQKEGEAMISAIKPSDHVVCLDVKGKQWSTPELAKQLKHWQHLGSNVSLLVGGPDGLSEECLKRAQQSWSLSHLTFPHPMVRVILAESLYRAWSVNNGHPYHRE